MATEKWLIDVNKFKHKMKLEFLDRRNKFISMNDLFECIDDMPTVATVEVVHGRWRIIDFKGNVECSECGHTMDLEYNYCPNCGAKMDGDENG